MKKHEVPAIILYLAGAGSVVYQMIYRQESLWQIIGGALTGIVCLLISRVTREGLGYGDSIGILALSIFLGFSRIVGVLMTAFFLLLCASILILTKRKMSRKMAIPFYPFLASAYACLLLAERMHS